MDVLWSSKRLHGSPLRSSRAPMAASWTPTAAPARPTGAQALALAASRSPGQRADFAGFSKKRLSAGRGPSMEGPGGQNGEKGVFFKVFSCAHPDPTGFFSPKSAGLTSNYFGAEFLTRFLQSAPPFKW